MDALRELHQRDVTGCLSFLRQSAVDTIPKSYHSYDSDLVKNTRGFGMLVNLKILVKNLKSSRRGRWIPFLC